MQRVVYQYRFDETVVTADVEGALLLAIFGIEALHGEAQARLDARHVFDSEKRACVVDASTPVGETFNRLLAGFLCRELSPDQFTVKRLHEPADEAAVVAA